MLFRVRSLLLALLAVLSVAGPAEARQPGSRLLRGHAAISFEPMTQFGASSSVCFAGDGGCSDGLVGYGIGLTLRLPPIVAGLVFDTGSMIFAESHLHLGGMAGIGLDPARWMRIELLAELGVHQIDGVGDTLFGAQNPVDYSLPYVGARLGWSARFGSGSVRPLVGIWASVRRDLQEETASLTSSLCPMAACGTLDYDVGGTTAMIAIRGGVEIR